MAGSQRSRADGVPNYFGEQRFGRNGNNLDLSERLFAGERMKRERRSLAVSAARSYLFNEILGSRVSDGSWNRILAGELANLDGSGSVFAVEQPDTELEQRCRELDIHPTASLYGKGLAATGQVAAIEDGIFEKHAALTAGLDKIGAKRAQRPLRLKVTDLSWQLDDDVLWLEFELLSGGYATSVLREIADFQSDRNNT